MMNQNEQKPVQTSNESKDQTQASPASASSLSDNPMWKGVDLARSAYDLALEKKVINPIKEISGMEQSAATASRLLGIPGLAMTFAAHATDAEKAHDPHSLRTAAVETGADQLVGHFVPAPIQIGIDAAAAVGETLQHLIEPELKRREKEPSALGRGFSIPDDPRDDVLEAAGMAGALRVPKKAEEFASGLVSKVALGLLEGASKLQEQLSGKEEQSPEMLEQRKPAKCPRVEGQTGERKIEQKRLGKLFALPVDVSHGSPSSVVEGSSARDSRLSMDLGISGIGADRPVTMTERYAPFFSRTSLSVSAAVPPPPRPETQFEKEVRLKSELGGRLADAVKRKDPIKAEQAITEAESKMRGQSDDGPVLLGSMVMPKREALNILQTAADAAGTSQQGGQLLRSDELLKPGNIPGEIRPQVESLLRQRQEHFSEAQKRQEHADRNLRRPMRFLLHKTARHGESERDEHRALGVACEKQALKLVRDYAAGVSNLPGCQPR